MVPTVSVIIPCYRQARFIEGCIESLRAQTYTHWQAIIVDDGSPDNAGEIGARVVALDGRVSFIQRPNGGPSAARNTGLRASTGAYIQFLDADDFMKPEKLQRHVAMLDADEELDLVYGNAWYFDHDEPNKRVRQGFGENANDDWIANAAALPMPPLLQLIQLNIMPICSPLFRRSVLDQAGFMNESFRALEDWEFWIRCANAGTKIKFDPSPETECLIRLHAGSASQNRAFMLGAEVAMRVACMGYLRDEKARRLTLACIGRLLAWREGTDRASTYRQLQSHTIGAEERAALWVAAYLGPGTLLHSLARPIIKRLPWHIRSLAAI